MKRFSYCSPTAAKLLLLVLLTAFMITCGLTKRQLFLKYNFYLITPYHIHFRSSGIQFKTPEETVVPGTIYLNLKQHLCVTTKKVSRCLYLRIKRTPISCRNIFCWGREWYIDVMPGHGWTPTSEVDDLNSLS